jgi:carboxypeptidase Taq
LEAKLRELKTRLSEINDLESAAALLSWDQSTYMPPGGGEARARQLSTLGQLAHAKFTDPEIGRLLDALEPYGESQPYDSDDASLIRVTRRDYERAVKLPADLVAEIANNQSTAYQVWADARPANDFAAVRPYLEKTVELSRRYAECFPGYEHIADPLIDGSDYGMKVSSVRAIFAELREQLVPMVQAITAQPPVDESFLHRHYPEAQQLAFGEEVIKRLGYDFTRGRQDKTHHPFMTRFAHGDVRITTRSREDDVTDAFFTTLHETGHGLYEQGVSANLDGTPLAHGASAGVHESQSRLWENIVGRSRPFWEFYYPQLQAVFPEQLGDVALDDFHRAVNIVKRSLIRTDADEVTYNLHVIMRFDFELDLLEGKLAVRDLPEAWHARYQADLGTRAPDDRDGVLQDVHWFAGFVGGEFQGYTLGNVLSALFYDSALKAHPQIPDEIAQGEFGTLHGWLTQNLYQHGRKFTAPEVIERATGGPLRTEPYLRYLKTKYGQLYKL